MSDRRLQTRRSEPRRHLVRVAASPATELVSLYVASIAGAVLLSAMLVQATGGSWRSVWTALLDGSIRNPGRWGVTIGAATPLLLVALGTIVNTKAGLVNIGQEGQLLIGGACAALVSVHLGSKQGWPGSIVLVLMVVAGVLGGAIWAGIAALLRYWRNVPEVLSTLLMVSLAVQLVAFGFSRESLLLAPLTEGQGIQAQLTLRVPEDARIERVTLFGNEFALGAIAAVLLSGLVAFLVARSVFGFRLRMLGQNPRVAQRSGVPAARYGTAALAISGGFAGLAGAFMLASGDFGNFRFSPGFSVNLGWTGLLVALVARERALAAIVVAFVFASLRTGSGFLAATGVERRITDVVQALLVLALLLPPAILFLRQRRRALAANVART